MYTKQQLFNLLSGISEIMRGDTREAKHKRIEALKRFYSNYDAEIASDNDLWEHITLITNERYS